jgi:hypothetical protein
MDGIMKPLSLEQLSRQALVSGIPLGFNCVEVLGSAQGIQITWGDLSLRNHHYGADDWALSYSELHPCIRASRTFTFGREILESSTFELDRIFTQALLELIDPPMKQSSVSASSFLQD